MLCLYISILNEPQFGVTLHHFTLHTIERFYEEILYLEVPRMSAILTFITAHLFGRVCEQNFTTVDLNRHLVRFPVCQSYDAEIVT
jgi:hypothetical protein